MLDRLCWWDWVAFAIIAVLCTVLFGHEDIITTAEHSFVYLKGHILDFYSACKEFTGGYWANYLPSTFIVFAIWNLPLFLLGQVPTFSRSSTFLMLEWYKLLPIAVYLLSGWLVYKICQERFEFSATKARVTAYIFLSAPLAFFSQFIFSQYDIFTVFFMLLGMYAYFHKSKDKKHMIIFSLCFGVATTFKYFAILIFVVMLLLRIKDIGRILLYALLAALPFLLEFSFYTIFDAEAFNNAVFGFTALSYANYSIINVGIANIKLVPLFLCAIVAWSWFVKPQNNREEICYSLYLSCAVCAVLFTLMTWHPQWLLFVMPFWVLSTVINKNYDVFLWLDSALIIVFYAFVSKYFANGVDQSMLKNGIFSFSLHDRILTDSLHMSEIYTFKDMDLLFTLIAILIIIFFVAKHPKFCMDDITQELTRENMATKFTTPIIAIRIRFLAGVLGFAIPALLCLPSMLAQPRLLWQCIPSSESRTTTSRLTEQAGVSQLVTINGEAISEIHVITATIDKNGENLDSGETLKSLIVNLKVIDPLTEKIVATSSLKGKSIANNDYSIFEFDNAKNLKSGKQYVLEFSVKEELKTEGVVLYYGKFDSDIIESEEYGTMLENYSNDSLNVKDKKVRDNYLFMKIFGE